MDADGIEKADQRGIQSVTLALNILEHFAHTGGGIGVSALAQALDATKSRVHRHLQTLVAEGFVEQHPGSDRYVIGPRIIRMGQRVRENINLTVVGLPIIKDLRDTVRHLTVLSAKQGPDLRILASASGVGRLEVGFTDGTVLSPHGSAQGKVTMAFDAAYRDLALSGKLEKFTPRTITSKREILDELETVRRQGWAASTNEFIEGVNAISAPIFDSAGTLVGTIGICDFLQYFPSPPSDEVIRELCNAALRISITMGYRLPAPIANLRVAP